MDKSYEWPSSMACLRQIFIHLDGGPIFRPFFPSVQHFCMFVNPLKKMVQRPAFCYYSSQLKQQSSSNFSVFLVLQKITGCCLLNYYCTDQNLIILCYYWIRAKSKCRNWISCPKSKSFSKGQFNEAYFLQYFEPFLKIFYQHHDKKKLSFFTYIFINF